MFMHSFFYFQYTESLFSTTGCARYQGKTINNMVFPYFSKYLALVEGISIWNKNWIYFSLLEEVQGTVEALKQGAE